MKSESEMGVTIIVCHGFILQVLLALSNHISLLPNYS